MSHYYSQGEPESDESTFRAGEIAGQIVGYERALADVEQWLKNRAGRSLQFTTTSHEMLENFRKRFKRV